MYSEKELALIHYYFPQFDDRALESITALPLYRMMVEEAFMSDNCDDIFSCSLRRCMNALRECKIYRLAPEFDALIDDRVLIK